MNNKTIVIVLSVLTVIILGVAIFSISRNSSLNEYITQLQDNSRKVSDEVQKNQEKLQNLEIQKDKLQAVLNKVSPWLDKDYYDSFIGTHLESENKSLFPPPPAITPRDLDNKLTSLIDALQKKITTDKSATQTTINKIENLKAPIMEEFKKIFDTFEKLREDFSSVNSINQQLHKEKEELIAQNNQKTEKLNQEISNIKEESNKQISDLKASYQNQINELTKKNEQRVLSLIDSTNNQVNILKDSMSKEKGTLKEDVHKKLSQLQELIADLNTLAEKSFDNYYQLKKKSYTGIFFSNKKMLEDLENEKENFYSRFNNVKDNTQKIFGVSTKEKAPDTAKPEAVK